MKTLAMFLALGASLLFTVSCSKQQTEEERRAEIERAVEERLAAERRTQEMADRQAELDAREQALADRAKEAEEDKEPAAATPGRQQPRKTAMARSSKDEVGTASYETFYQKLEPHGSWFETGDYGYVWQPQEAVRSREWRPYTEGRWAYTDAGWTWLSDEPYGWATYHYGRWARLRNVGWVWVPGDEWAPAWVSWRKNENFVGWAPLPPEARFERRTGIKNWSDSHYDIGPDYYAFVPVDELGGDEIQRAIVPRERNVTMVTNTTNVTNITYNNTIIVNHGPNYEEIRTRTRQPIERLRLEREYQITEQPRLVLRGEVVALPAPNIVPMTRVVRPRIGRERIQQTTVDYGWASVESGEQQKVRAKVHAEATPPPSAPANRFVRPDAAPAAEPAGAVQPPAAQSPAAQSPAATTPAATPTATASPRGTAAPTATLTPSATIPAAETPAAIGTGTSSPTTTASPTAASPTASPTMTRSPRGRGLVSPPPVSSPSPDTQGAASPRGTPGSPNATASPTGTPSPGLTPSPGRRDVVSPTPTMTASPDDSDAAIAPTPSPSPTAAGRVSATPGLTASPTATFSPGLTPNPGRRSVVSPSPAMTASPEESDANGAIATTPRPSPTAAGRVSATPGLTASPTATFLPGLTPNPGRRSVVSPSPAMTTSPDESDADGAIATTPGASPTVPARVSATPRLTPLPTATASPTATSPAPADEEGNSDEAGRRAGRVGKKAARRAEVGMDQAEPPVTSRLPVDESVRAGNLRGIDAAAPTPAPTFLPSEITRGTPEATSSPAPTPESIAAASETSEGNDAQRLTKKERRNQKREQRRDRRGDVSETEEEASPSPTESPAESPGTD